MESKEFLKKIVGYLPYGVGIVNSIGIKIELTVMDFGYHINNGFKPILRPLKDLIIEIEIDGKKFVPNDILRIFSPHLLSSDDVELLPYGIIKKLHQWHFDIHGLIDENLAIDINTIG